MSRRWWVEAETVVRALIEYDYLHVVELWSLETIGTKGSL